MNNRLRSLLFKTVLFVVTLSIGWWMIQQEVFYDFVNSLLPVQFLAEFVAGMFYASFITFPISMGMFFILARDGNPIILALIAGFGTAIADLIIIKIVKHHSRELETASDYLKLHRITKLLKKFNMDFLLPVIGAVIVASPLPDELGLFLLGVSKLRSGQIFVITYLLNTAGILLMVVPLNILERFLP